MNLREAKTEIRQLHRALDVIEYIVSDDASQEWGLTHPDELYTKKLMAIYRHAHSVRRGVCFDAHDDWRRDMARVHRQLVKHGVLGSSPQKKLKVENDPNC